MPAIASLLRASIIHTHREKGESDEAWEMATVQATTGARPHSQQEQGTHRMVRVARVVSRQSRCPCPYSVDEGEIEHEILAVHRQAWMWRVSVCASVCKRKKRLRGVCLSAPEPVTTEF